MHSQLDEHTEVVPTLRPPINPQYILKCLLLIYISALFPELFLNKK